MCRWQKSPAASEPGEPPDDPDRLAVLRAKAITAALMYSDGSDAGSEDRRNAFVPRVQDHVEAVGEFGIAQDIEDAIELGIRKVLFSCWQMFEMFHLLHSTVARCKCAGSGGHPGSCSC